MITILAEFCFIDWAFSLPFTKDYYTVIDVNPKEINYLRTIRFFTTNSSALVKYSNK